LVITSAHSAPPPQGWSKPQSAVHVPALHTWPAAHTVPHAPQFIGSLTIVLQAPAHTA
jgi:hypothetical protein